MASFYKSVTKGTTVDLYIQILYGLKSHPNSKLHHNEINLLISRFKDLRKSSDIVDLISKHQCRETKRASYPTAQELQQKDEYKERFKAGQSELANIIENILGREKAAEIYKSFNIAERTYNGNKQQYIKTVIDVLEAPLEKSLKP